MIDLVEIDLSGEVEYDLDSLLEASAASGGGGFDGNGDASPPESRFVDGDLGILPPDNPVSSESYDSRMLDLKKFLFDDGFGSFELGDEEFNADLFSGLGDEEFDANFFSDLFADEPEPAVAGEPVADSDGKGNESRKRDASSAAAVVGGAVNDDPIRKKRTRQMKNRDSAMKSREKKKIYVKELEMKSRYLESECHRLDYVFRCYVAENMALRQYLQKGGAPVAPMAKQESAVLVKESLLLGSLFWLVSIVCLFLMPSLPIPNQKDAIRMGRNLVQEDVATKKVENETSSSLGNQLVIMRRRWRGMRTRMKFCLSTLQVALPLCRLSI